MLINVISFLFFFNVSSLSCLPSPSPSTHDLQLISSKVPKAEYVPTILRRDDPSIIPILYVSLHTQTHTTHTSAQ